MRAVRISEMMINTPQSISLSGGVVGVNITVPNSAAIDCLVGWGEDASTKNVIEPGESKAYGGFDNYLLDGNELRIDFSSLPGRALITIFKQGPKVEGSEC